MIKIDDNNNILVTRGNTLTLTIGMYKKIPPETPEGQPTYEPYEPTENEVITFAVSKGFEGATDYERLITKIVPHDTKMITCESEETSLDYDTYPYEVTIVHEDNQEDTFISGFLTITGRA